ncbi:MarR family winged helix-turn-helix transcriptional regulator [Nocardia spumae]|uniref:MarR family winged helix-turn-helix transcriptional regulator n=1 Tax=Nocardia spumae TaxID=2887190 RepID=UPI001D1361D0|nr:MarR family transcriptional regulator [Nocardia spumae]
MEPLPRGSGRDIARDVGPIGYALALAARVHRVDLTHRLAELGLHPGQELIVVDLHENPGSTQAELVERMGIEQPTVAKAISRMERSGFVERSPDDSDRRVIRLRLSARGLQAVDSVRAAWRDAETVVTRHLSGAERRQLVSLLQRVGEV